MARRYMHGIYFRGIDNPRELLEEILEDKHSPVKRHESADRHVPVTMRRIRHYNTHFPARKGICYENLAAKQEIYACAYKNTIKPLLAYFCTKIYKKD